MIIIGIIKINNRTQGKRSLTFYNKFYSEIIKDSFKGKKNKLTKLLKSASYYNETKFEKAIKNLNSLLPYCNTNTEKYCVNLFLALNYSDKGDYKSAIEKYTFMMQNSLADSRIYSNLVNCYNTIGDYEKAEKIGKRAIAFDSKNYNAYNNLAYSAFKNGDYDSAIEYARKSIEIKNDFSPSIHLLYIIYMLEENQIEAEIYEKKAIANGTTRKKLQEILKYYLGD